MNLDMKTTDPVFGGHSMVTPLRRVLLNPPQHANWNRPQTAADWRELQYQRRPDFARAQAQHEELCRAVAMAGAEVILLPSHAALSLDAVYVHDASFMTNHGALLLRMGKPTRAQEPQEHATLYRTLGIAILGEIVSPGTVEAGDMVWLDDATLLIGRGYRTNAAGIAQVRELLAPLNVEVLSAPLPHGAGPEFCLHLMSLMSILDERTILVDLAWLSVETVELLRAREFKLLEIETNERDTLACNVLALGNRKLVALAENPHTNRRLMQAGFEVQTFHGSEIGINGGGGPTCLTRPLLRG